MQKKLDALLTKQKLGPLHIATGQNFVSKYLSITQVEKYTLVST